MFHTATIANVPNPAPFYIKNSLEPDMINVGWVLVSSNIAANAANAASSYQWDVLRSGNSVNQIGKDWFIGLGWDTASNANIAVTLFEQWNGSGSGGGTAVGSNTCLGYPPNFTQTSSLPQANAWCNVNPTTIAFTPGSNCQGMTSFSTFGISTLNFTYSHSVTIDRIIFMTSNQASINSGPAYYVGTYDSFMSPIQDPYPLLAHNFNVQYTTYGYTVGQLVGSPTNSSNSIIGMSTREPGLIPAIGTTNFTAGICGQINFNMACAISGNQVEYYSNKYLFSKGLVQGRTFSGAINSFPGVRGTIKDVYLVPVNANRGDTTTITINGNTYTAAFLTNNGPLSGYNVTISQFGLASFLQI